MIIFPCQENKYGLREFFIFPLQKRKKNVEFANMFLAMGQLWNLRISSLSRHECTERAELRAPFLEERRDTAMLEILTTKRGMNRSTMPIACCLRYTTREITYISWTYI